MTKKPQTKQKQQKGKLESRWTTVNSLPIHARVSNPPHIDTPTPIILVHGLVVSSRYMIPTAEQLALHYHVYVPDLPGFGKSAKPHHILSIAELADALAAWMDAMGLQRATMLGNSLGCQIIANFALRYPKCLERAILVGPTMDPQARTARQQIWRWLLNIPFEPISLFPVVIRDYLDVGFRRFVHTFRYALQDRIEEHLPAMHVPTLIVCGGRDTVVPQRWAEEAAQLLPHGQLVVIDRAAHDVNYNSPMELSDAVRQFINDTLIAHSAQTNAEVADNDSEDSPRNWGLSTD